MNSDYRTRDYEHDSESGMGDVALLLGWTPPPDDDGFWFKEPHGPVHDGDLRDLLVDEIRHLIDRSRSAFCLNDDDALFAFESIAKRRLWRKCTCDGDVGFACERCQRDEVSARNDPDFDPYQRDAEVAWRWAKRMLHSQRVEVSQ